MQAKAEAEAAAQLAQLQAEDKEHVLLDIVVLYSEDGYVDPPPGYWKVPYDLNKGAGGIFIYLATKTCSRQDPGLQMDGPNGLGTPITDLCVITGKSKDIQAPVGYTKVEGDLNQGTGGNFVYLCFHRGQLAEPIAELFTMGGKTSEVLSPPPGYAKIDADLNAGAQSGSPAGFACINPSFQNALLVLLLSGGHRIVRRNDWRADHTVREARSATSEPPPAACDYRPLRGVRLYRRDPTATWLVSTALLTAVPSSASKCSIVLTGGAVRCDTGSYKLPYDLNKGSSGNFVYLCYRLGFLDGPEEPVTDIVICADATRTGPGTQPPSPEYKRLETDLNKGG